MVKQVNNNDSNKQLYRSITLLDGDKFKKALASGAVIDSNRNKCTLNSAISTMSSHCPDRFNLTFIKNLIDYGAKPRNEVVNNTLTCAVRNYSHNHNKHKNCPLKDLYHTNKMNLIQLLIDTGALISNSILEKDNTLAQSIVTEDIELIRMIARLNPTPYSYILNIAIRTGNLEIVKIICRLGTEPSLSGVTFGRPNNDCDNTNTLNIAIRTKNLEIIKFIACHFGRKMKPIDNNSEENTLNIAISTKNVEIVKIVRDVFEAKPINEDDEKNNTLIRALLTRDPEIMKEIILANGRFKHSQQQYHRWWYIRPSPISILYNNFIKNGYDSSNKKLIKDLEQLLHMIMCVSGTLPLEDNFINDMVKTKYNAIFVEKIKTYCKIRNCILKKMHVNDKDSEEFKKAEVLIGKLKDTTRYLLESYHDKKNIIAELHDCIVSMPSCCIDIMYDYQSKPPLANLVDWSHWEEIILHAPIYEQDRA